VLIVRRRPFLHVAIGFGLYDEQIVEPQPFPSVEGARQPAGGPLRQEREGNDFIGGLRALRGNDLVQLQKDLGAQVELGEWAVGVSCGPGAEVRRLGARAALLGPLVDGGAATRRDGSRRRRRS
jgi:hypothetical protein